MQTHTRTILQMEKPRPRRDWESSLPSPSSFCVTGRQPLGAWKGCLGAPFPVSSVLGCSQGGSLQIPPHSRGPHARGPASAEFVQDSDLPMIPCVFLGSEPHGSWQPCKTKAPPPFMRACEGWQGRFSGQAEGSLDQRVPFEQIQAGHVISALSSLRGPFSRGLSPPPTPLGPLLLCRKKASLLVPPCLPWLLPAQVYSGSYRPSVWETSQVPS